MSGALSNKVALITGAASGIGLATAQLFVHEGAQVVLVDVDKAAGKKAADTTGGLFVEADVSDIEQSTASVRAAEAAFGGLDVAFLNAGIASNESDMDHIDPTKYRQLVGVNLDGVVFGAMAALPAIERRGGGALVATASLAGLTPYPPDPLYALTKHGVIGLVRSLADQLRAKGITVNCICPGIVDTPLLGDHAEDLRRAGFPLLQPGDIAVAVLIAVTGTDTGQAFVCQPGRDPEPYRFRGVPGPRVPAAEGMRPPTWSKRSRDT